MDDVVSFPISLDSDLGRELIVDCVRFAEGILDERQVRKKYRFSNDDWEKLGNDDSLVEAIELEKQRRIRDGSTKRERAQQLIVKAPDILGGIMNDPTANARHRIDSVKVLDDLAANGPAAAPTADRFIIQINLGSDTLRFDKSIAVDANDVDPFNDVDTGVIAAIAAKKSTEGGSGEPI